MAVTEELNIIPSNTLPNADQEDVNGGKVIIVNSYGDVKKADSLVMKGDKGDQGIQGIQGEKGDTGAKGDKGAQGIQGERGVQGEKGDRGIQGVKGDSGKSAYELWLQQPGNAGKPYSEYEAYNREPATAAKNEWNVLKPEITNKITEAGEAISNANTSASNADSKAGLANTAATNANTAASEANTAKEGVLDAIDNANDTAEHPTYIGTDFYVYKWDKATKQYVKTDIFVKGSAGAGNVDIINSTTVKKDVPYVIVPTANAAQTYNAVEAGTLNVDWKAKNLGLWGVQRTRKELATIYDNVAEFSTLDNLTGVFLITTPVMYAAMCRMIIKVYDGFNLDNQYATIDGTFYNQATTKSTKGRYILLGSNSNIDAVKFGIKDGKLCIIIGNGNKTWNSPRVIIEKVTHTHNNIVTDISSGWTIENITEIPDTISEIKDAILVSRTVSQEELDAKAAVSQLSEFPKVPVQTNVVKGVHYGLVPTADGGSSYTLNETIVGARNLFKNSGGGKYVISDVIFGEDVTTAEIVTIDGVVGIRQNKVSSPTSLVCRLKAVTVKPDTHYSIGLWIYIPDSVSYDPSWRHYASGAGGTYAVKSWSNIERNKWTFISDSFVTQSGYITDTIHSNFGNGIIISDLMYAEGSIPNTWSPAPEDKLNVTDVINNLTSTDTNKPLSAAQGKLLQDNKASTTQLNSAISDFNTRFAGQYEIVSVLPAVGVEGKMYLVATGTANVYNLFTWKSISGVYQWVDLCSTTVDLSQYAKSADVTSALSNKVDKVSGKGLSTNDYTNDEKSEVAKIANKADLGEDGKVLPSQLPAMSEGLGKPQEIKLLLSDAMPSGAYDGNYGFVWSLSTDGDSFVENCRFSLSCGYDAMPPSVWSIYVDYEGTVRLYAAFVEGPFTEYLILDRYTGFSNSAAPISAPFSWWRSDKHIAQNTGGVDASIGGMFTLTASGTLNVSFTNLSYIPLGKSLRIRIKGNNSTNRTITIIPDGVTNELDNTSYQVNNVKTLELDIVNFGGEFIMKGVLYE